MGSVFVISEGVSWAPTGWVFDGVLERATTLLAEGSLRDLLTKGIGPRAYADITNISQQEFSQFLAAVRTDFELAASQGESILAMPAYYSMFMGHYSLLKMLLSIDDRCAEPDQNTVILSINKGASWNAPSQIADLILESFAFAPEIFTQFKDLSARFLIGRSIANGSCDIEKLAQPEFCSVVSTTRWIDGYHGEGMGMVAPKVTAWTKPFITDLYNLIEADPRVKDCNLE